MALAAPPTAQPPLPDELLEDIFLRLDAAEDLARASASCASFRRIVSARGFLRRFRSLHPPPVLGFLDCRNLSAGAEFYQARPPRKWAPAARAFAQAADFTFSFLDDPSRWCVRDGRVLLARTAASSWLIFDEFMVYDPLYRQYVQIPPIPGDLTAFARQPGTQLYETYTYFEPFLAPAAWEEEEPSLRVFCNVMSKAKVVTFFFSPVIGMWQAVASFSTETHQWMGRYSPLLLRHCAHSCVYWTYFCQKVMLVLDTLEMKFSVVDLPPEIEDRARIILEAADDRLGLLIIDDLELHLYSKTRRDNGVGAEEWRHDKTIPLPNCCYWFASNGGAAEGYVLLRGIPRDQCDSGEFLERKPDAPYLTLQVKTMLLERLCVSKFETSPDYLYASFPPPLSPPSI